MGLGVAASKLYVHASRSTDEEFRQIYRELGRLRAGGGTGTGTGTDGDGDVDPEPPPPPPLVTQLYRFAKLLVIEHQYNPPGQATVHSFSLANVDTPYTVVQTYNYPLSWTGISDPAYLTLRLRVLGTSERLRPYGPEEWINPLYDHVYDYGYWPSYLAMKVPRAGDLDGRRLWHYPINPREGQDTIRARLSVDYQTTFCYRSWLTGIYMVHGTVLTNQCPGDPV